MKTKVKGRVAYTDDSGLLHRENGPAVEYASGTKLWYLRGNLHRIDGPAVEYASGTKLWYLRGNLHRIDGPAVEWSNGDKEWYINGDSYTDPESFCDAAGITGKHKTLFLLTYSGAIV